MSLIPILFPSPQTFKKKKLKKAEEGPQTSQRDLLNLALKFFNKWEEQAKPVNAQRDQAKYHL